MKPFILRAARRLPTDLGPAPNHVYDAEMQIWIQTDTGEPVVRSDTTGPMQTSRFGETTLTETREGADQPEILGIRASRFGETGMTKTMEGADQGEGAFHLGTRFGETTSTATREGIDQPEISEPV